MTDEKTTTEEAEPEAAAPENEVDLHSPDADPMAVWEAHKKAMAEEAGESEQGGQDEPKGAAEAGAEPGAEEAPEGASDDAEDAGEAEAPSDPEKALAARLRGEEPEKKPSDIGELPDEYAQALKRTGMRDAEIAELSALSAEKPWISGWLDGLARRQSETDDRFAALKGAREPTPDRDGSGRPPEDATGDQPGSVSVDALDKLADSFREELGDDKAEALRSVLTGLHAANADLRKQVQAHTESLARKETALELEGHVQSARRELGEQFPQLKDDSFFEQVADDVAEQRPDGTTGAIRKAMERAARARLYDQARAEAKSEAARADNVRKERGGATSPTVGEAETEPVLDEMEEAVRQLQMMKEGVPEERITAWLRSNQERRNRQAAANRRR